MWQDQLEEQLSMGNSNWRSATERIELFCRWAEELLIRIEHDEIVGRSVLIRLRQPLIFLFLFYAIVLNILILSFADSSGGFHSNMFIVLQLMGLFALLLAVLIFMGFILENGRPIHFIQWKNRYHRHFLIASSRNLVRSLTKPSILFTFEERREYIRQILPHLPPLWLPPTLKYFLYSSLNFLSDFSIDGTIYQISLLVVILLAIALHPFFYCFLLIDVVRVSRTLQTVLVAVFKMKKIFFLIIFLMVTAVYILSLYIFVVYPVTLQNSPSGLSCDYPFCILSFTSATSSLSHLQ